MPLSPKMGFPLRHTLVSLAAGTSLVLAVPGPSQALLVYSAEGSGISGTLGGEAFTDASWNLTATANETLSILSTVSTGQGTFQLWWLPVAPRVKITTMATVLEADLLPAPPYRWIALSGIFPVGFSPKIGFVYTTPWFNPETAAGVFSVPESFVNLRSPVNFAGSSIFETNSYATSAGPLMISASNTVPGVFRIHPVPSPLPGLAIVGAFSWSRRLRYRIAQGPSREAVGLG